MRVLALTKYDMLAASSRQRFRQYQPALEAAGITIDYAPLLGDDHVAGLVDGRRLSKWRVVRAYAHRMATLLRASDYDALWVHYELFPYLPGLFERLVCLHHQPIIVDLDDAIFHNYDQARSPLVRLLLGRKLEPLLRAADTCCCGNAYLMHYAETFCPRSIVVPTVVDTDSYVPYPFRAERALTIGWIGSPTTYSNLRYLLPLLHEIVSRHGVRVRIIGAGTAAERDRFYGLDLVEWSEATEITDVQAMDIGVMPLVDQAFQRGKSGYKLIQYMACGLPVVASPVGVNSEIVEAGVNGFLATTIDEWQSALEQLIADAGLRQRMGNAGRHRAVERYSLQSQAPVLVDLFRSIGALNRPSK